MAIFVIIIFCLVIFHYVYESALAPQLRLKLRYELFALRDNLRTLRFDHPDQVSDECFKTVETIVNNSIFMLPHITHGFLSEAKHALENNPAISKRVEKKMALVNECTKPEVKAIVEKSVITSFIALNINSGGWFPVAAAFLIVIIPIMLFIGAVNRVKRAILQIAVVPDYMMNKIVHVPGPDIAAAV